MSERPGIRIIVCGSRYYRDVPYLWRALDELHAERRIRAVIEGASDDVTGPYIGADYWAHQWACAHDIPTDRRHADWRRLGRAAGPTRNQQMLDENRPDAIVHFPGGTGTADMVRRAKAAGIELIPIHNRHPIERGRE